MVGVLAEPFFGSERSAVTKSWASGAVYLLVSFLVAVIGLVQAQGISYTVQMIAVSDEARALRLRGELAEQGYPAYLLTVPTPQGPVYRLRVGAFANRDAAARYAEHMPSVGDSVPAPALAESIPQGLIPLEPELLGSFDLKEMSVKLLPWREGMVLRAQALTANREALYKVVGGPAFSAWRAVPESSGFIRVRSLGLWPEGHTNLSETERAASAEAVLTDVAAELGLTPEQVASFAFAGEPPFLGVLERVNLATGESTLLRALGQPASGLDGDGPDLRWLGGTEPLKLEDPAVLFEPRPDSETPPVWAGDGWQARVDGEYTELHAEASQKSWRAVVGRPVWAMGSVLVTISEDEALVYHLVTR